MLDRLIPLFDEGGRFHGRYTLSPQPEHTPKELLPDAVWEIPVFPHGSQSFELLRVYAFDSSTSSLLHAHWRNEARAILRLSTRGYRTLPQLREADVLREADLAYLIVTDSGDELESDPGVLAELISNRKRAFLAFFEIVEAVAAMHEEGLIHRNLTTKALRVAGDGPIVVDGFQMSAFASAWLRPRRDAPANLLAPTGRVRWMLAPERVASLIDGSRREYEHYSTDVFSLGIIGIALLVGPSSEPPAEYSRDAHLRWTTQQRDAMRRAGLPIVLERILGNMLEFHRANRFPSAAKALDELAKAYGTILGDLEWPPVEDAPTYELLYLPESIKRLYDDGRGRSHPSRPDFVEYNELIAEDLVGGILTWSPDGFEPWERKTANRRIARTACVVLIGRDYAYFCAYLDVGRASEDRSRIVVKHMLPIERADALRRSPRQRAVPRIACGYFEPTARRPVRVPGTDGDWSALVETVEFDGGRSYRDPVVATAKWLLDAQRADLRRAWYGVECKMVGIGLIQLHEISRSPPEASNQSASQGTDDPAEAFDELWEQVSPREPMGKLYGTLVRDALETQEQATPFFLRKRRADRSSIAELRLESVLDPHTCTFRVERSMWGEDDALPSTAWVMPDDSGARSQLRRQAEAVLDIERRYGHLAAQMRAPMSFRIPTEDRVSDESASDATRALVQRIHETWPLFTLQGPPGTGKTFVATRVLERVLAADPFARVLVAAQSHHALDNLLEGAVRGMPGVPVLRIASEFTREKLSELARDHQERPGIDGIIESIREADDPDDARFGKLAREWKGRTHDAEVELRADLARRLPRASSIIFSTCAQATSQALGASRGRASFDWVLIEEAARGWMTEFFIPMVHGARWLLVGDHAQLPAHRFHEYEQLLRRDISDRVTADATEIGATSEWLGLLKHFAHLMTTSDGRDVARDRLRLQRRMHPDIAGLIATSFYGGDLDSHPDATRVHGIREEPFGSRNLVWLDTSGLASDAHELERGGLWNRCELKVLKYYFRNRVGDVSRHEADIAPLAVLTPYRAQARRLGEQLGYGDGVVHTVHSFQGCEAEVVLVSLVRNNASAPEKALGFLTDPSIANVMFSRGRRLLVIAGSLEHFARNGRGTFWDKVVGYVRSDPRHRLDVAADGFSYTRRAQS